MRAPAWQLDSTPPSTCHPVPGTQRRNTRDGATMYVEYARYADNLAILVNSFPR